MCGIIGQVNFNSAQHSLPNLNLLNHRGPDGNGEWKNIGGNVYFGHTRLAILEPTLAGKQPMISVFHRFTITFNGEIYNHLKLRLLLPDIKWKGSSDTETLLELLAVKGLAALPLLKGMFAFALHDNVDDSVLLVRDRLGIKPLWFYYENNTFTFSSEVRALSQSIGSTLNTKALSEYISFGRMPSTGEIYTGMQSLPPGSWIKLLPDGKMIQEYWWPNGSFNYSKLNNYNDCVLRVNKLVTKAVQEHLISDVGVGAFLSGGIDSSIVTIVAGKELGKSLRTFTVGFPQNKFDERVIARKVATQVGSDHNELEVSENDCLDWVQEAVLNLDLPSVDAINTFIVSKAVRNAGLKVALSGLGGDELFGGYPSFKDIPLLKWLKVLNPGIRSKLMGIIPGSLKSKLDGLNSFTATDLTVARRRFTSVKSLIDMGLEDGIPDIYPSPDQFDTMGEISWGEIQGYMIPMLLRDSDQMSMAVGLEIRVPFLDHELVEEALSIQQKFKKGKGVKSLLVEAFRSELPSEVYNKPKQGFTLPMEDWIEGPLAKFTNEGIGFAADFLHLKEPLTQKDLFQKKLTHWTRVWKWCVLGHWMSNQNAV